jgi:aryl-alcohol dehydrogenase-like predicted oxidoreductase/spore coat polysaccharide biosynthesis protein SpsF (cytidylyltransferase family)
LKTVTIVQARTGSSRLPAKALLPVAGYPSAILATLRAANQKHETMFATSDDAADDELARQAEKNGLSVFRGPLDDVLGRYHFASADFPDDGVVIRLTADNVVPDGDFVEDLARAFASSGTEYVSTDSSGLPYGLGGEAFSVAALRRAYREATSANDREHVTPWIRRNCSSAVHRPERLGDFDFSHLRCTIDDQEDYDRMLRLFDGVADPARVGWFELLHRLADLPGEAKFRVPHRMIGGRTRSELTLGTVQLGMEYGVTNDAGQPPMAEAVSMVRKAIAHGVSTLDTARGYGTAEEVLGEALSGAWSSRVEVITKLNLAGLAADASTTQARTQVDESVNLSCQALRTNRLPVVLLHRWQDHDSWRGAAWHRLLELRDAGKIAALGASVYEPSEALEAFEDSAIEHLQIPLNVLDWRWEEAEVDRAAASRTDVIVHARSALLQGILAHPARRWPKIDGVRPEEYVEKLEKLSTEFERESVTDLCLAYVRSLPWVTSVVLGCETMHQLDKNLTLFRNRKLTAAQCQQLRRELPQAPDTLLNPVKWKAIHEPASR